MSNVWGKQKNKKGIFSGQNPKPRPHGKAVHTPTLLLENENGDLKPYKPDPSQPVEDQKATIISSITGQ